MHSTKTLGEYKCVCRKENSVVYTLTQNSKFFSETGWVNVYGIIVCEYYGGEVVQSFKISDYSSKIDKTLELISILSRNKVKPMEISEVLEDLLG